MLTTEATSTPTIDRYKVAKSALADRIGALLGHKFIFRDKAKPVM
jgi:hypothetical protein